MGKLLHEELSKKVLGAAFAVHNELGAGLLEKPYHNALYYELKEQGVHVQYEHPFEVLYKGEVVGEYFADLVVEGSIILEVKAVRELEAVMEAQLINYLRIGGMRLGYLLNFAGNRVVWKRLVVG